MKTTDNRTKLALLLHLPLTHLPSISSEAGAITNTLRSLPADMINGFLDTLLDIQSMPEVE
jgi:hypothetical protein